MRKITAVAMLAALALLVFAQAGSNALSGFAKALNSAESLDVQYTIQTIGGTPDSYKVSLSKPNKARIDKPSELTVADGTTITVFDKKTKTYYKRPQTPGDLGGIFSADDVSLWAAFFNGDVYSKANATSKGTKNRKGTKMNVVEAKMDHTGRKQMVFYIDPADNVARQAEITYHEGKEKLITIIDAKSLTLGEKLDDAMYAFKAPDGARELTAEEMNADRWYTDLEEAKKVAVATKRAIFVDFYADW